LSDVGGEGSTRRETRRRAERPLRKTADVGHVPLRREGPDGAAFRLPLASRPPGAGVAPQRHVFSGQLLRPPSLAARLRRLAPRPVDVRKAAFALARALAVALYVARRCRDSPRWKIRTWEAEAMILDAVSTLAWTWPTTHRALRKELKKLGEEAPV